MNEQHQQPQDETRMAGGWGPPGGGPPGYGPPGGQMPPGGGYGQPPGGHGQPPGGGYGQPGGFGPPAYGYEFSHVENQTIDKVATWAKGIGIVGFVMGASSLLQLNIVGAAIELIVGMMFFQAGKAFESVVHTQGNDIQHMMEALGKVSTAFTIKLVLFGLVVVLMICALLLIIPLALSNLR